jgi:UDP-N-acetyl-D-galactosamine dehydrogenase
MLKNGINVASATVGLLGITFKENCPDVRNSKVIDIVRELQLWGLTVKVMDPWTNSQISTAGIWLGSLSNYVSERSRFIDHCRGPHRVCADVAQ